jgi:hypothetical protein
LITAIRLPDLKSLPAPLILFFGFGLSVPLFVGAVSGNEPLLILRDVIAFSFLLLPLLFMQTLKNHTELLPGLLVFTGCAFALRTLLPYGDDIWHPESWLGRAPADLLYLANSPEVLFAGIILLCGGVWRIWEGRAILSGSLMAGLAALPLLSMAVMMQRAGIGCVALSMIFLGCVGMCLRPATTALLIMCLGLLVLPLVPLLGAVVAVLWQKTEMVGFNSRIQEWEAVWAAVGRTPLTLLAGLGWGGSLENPAVGNLRVNYTHSLMSSLLLKSGLAGVALFLCYLWIIAKLSVPELLRRPILVLALGAPLGIGLFLYANYKSLGFGLLLLLLCLLPLQRKLEKNQVDMQ